MQPYKKLYTYWFSLIIYDLVVEFCDRWIKSYKLKEQMNGAARSGKQNIVEGSDALKTSLKSGIKLTNVAKSSEEELLGDVEDFIRQRGLKAWDKNDPRVREIRDKSAKLVRALSNLSTEGEGDPVGLMNRELFLPKEQEDAANLLLTLLHQETYLLNKQVEALEKKHEKEGGYTEKLYNKRKAYLQNKVPKQLKKLI